MDLRSPGVGKVLRIEIAAGAQVARGQELMIIESMKVEIPIKAAAAGRVREVTVGLGDHVARNQVLVRIE